VAALLPVLLMRPHLAAEWCRHYSFTVAGSIAATLLVANNVSSQHNTVNRRAYLRVALGFGAALTIILAVPVFTGTSVQGLMEGLFLTPLKMPGVSLLPLPLGMGVLLNTAAALFVASVFVAKPDWICAARSLPVFKIVYGFAGSLWLLGDAKTQIGYLLPWVWLVLVRGPIDPKSDETFPRVFLCLAAVWQSLQAYPIAGTQVVTATVLLVLIYVVCLRDALEVFASMLRRKMGAWGRGFEQLRPQTVRFLQALGVVAFLYVFTNVWCKLPVVRHQYAELPPLGLRGSRYVHTDTEVTVNYRALTQYLESHCDTFVTYPGINSLYFWTGKRPPTHLNSTGWGQLSHRQQEQILSALGKARQPVLVAVAPAVESWVKSIPPQISPLVHFIRENCREVTRIGVFILFVPSSSGKFAAAAAANRD